MTRFGAAVAGFLLAAGSVVPMAWAAGPEPVSPQADASFAEIAGCLASGDELRVDMVVDESRSLQQTDSKDQRTAGLLAALDSLSVLQSAYPDKQINVAAATFAANYVPRIGWGQASGDHLQELRNFAINDVPGLNEGTSTDYRAAIKGAQQDLGSGGGSACKVMLWFTDGGLDVQDSDSATQAALSEICTVGGIADAARSDGVHIVAGALFRADQNLVDDQDRATLAQVAEADAKGGTCGTVPLPERYAGGAYVSANDPSQLSALFASLLARISGFTSAETTQCPGDGCVSGVYRFAIDPGIAWVRLIAVPAAGSAPQYSITEPSGTSAALPVNDSVPLGPFRVETSQAGATAQFDINLTAGDPVGQWEFNIKDGSALIGLYLLPGLQVTLEPADQQLAADAATDVALRISNSAGQPVDPGIYGSFAVTGSVDGIPTGSASQRGDQWILSVPAPPAGALPSSRQLSVSVDIVTAPSGQQLDPVVRQFIMPVSLSAYYPALQTQELVMTPVEGDGDSTGLVQVTGSGEGPSKACIGPATLSGPTNQSPVEATPEQQCIELQPGESGSLALHADPFTVAADGTMSGSTQVTLSSVRSGDEDITFEIPARMSIARTVDEAVRWLLVAALVLLSLLVPALLIYFLGRRLARFETGSAEWVRVLRVPVVIAFSQNEARIERDSRPLWLGPDDVSSASPEPPHGKKAWSGGGVELETRFQIFGHGKLGPLQVPTLALNPSAAASSQHQGVILVSDYAPYLDADEAGAPCQLRIERSWFLEFDQGTLRDALQGPSLELPESGRVPAQLVVVRLDTDMGTYAEQGEGLAAETQKPLRMLHAAARKARELGPAERPVVSVVSGTTSTAGPDWMGGGTSSQTDPSSPFGQGPSPTPRPEPPSTQRPGDDGTPDWLRG